MLMHLREIPGIDIPTTRQLNNFLSAVRDKLNCWAHAIRNIDDELKCVVNKMNRSEMREDIIRIQLVYTEKLFEAATKLFYRKWSNIINLATRLPRDTTSSTCYVDLKNDVFKMMVLTHRRKQGRPANTVAALARQPNELQDSNTGGILYNNDEEATTLSQAIAKKKPKRGRPCKEKPLQEESLVVAATSKGSELVVEASFVLRSSKRTKKN